MKLFKKKGLDYVAHYPLFFTIVFVIVIIQYSFSSLESFFYDLRIRFDFGMSVEENIVIVTLDEESEEFLGERFPYTYATHARFIDKLAKDKPRVINYFLNLNDPDSPEEETEQENFKRILQVYKDNGGAFRFGTTMDSWGEQLPPESLRGLGYSLGLLNVDSSSFAKDEVCRRGLLNISGDDSLHLWTANRFLLGKGEGPVNAKSHQGAYYLSEADATFTMFRYFSSPLERDGKITKIPYHRVLVGNFPKGFFSNKIVLVGSQYISKSVDYIFTPFNKEEKNLSPRLNVHAQFIEALLQGKTIYPVDRKITDFLCFIVALGLSYIISKVRPTRGLIITVSTIVGIVLISFFLFSLFGLWIYITHLILTIFIVYYIWVPFRAIAEYQTRYAIEEESKLIKKVEHLKQNFISLMSHDLKTPVARIAGIADILSVQYAHGQEQKSHVESIIQATKELNRFITSILDLTKIESEKLNLKKVSKDINQLVESVLEGLKFEAQAKNMEIKKDLSPLYPIQIDVDLIKRVISNLVENAIKYSGEGRFIEVKTWDDEKWVYLEIKDTGIGIAAENLEHIFDKFYRVSNDATHSIKGSGLGLYLVKYFVELHGGVISVQSVVGEGTVFRVKLKNS